MPVPTLDTLWHNLIAGLNALTGRPVAVAVDANGRLLTTSVIAASTDWEITLLSDTTINQNSKVLTVPAGYEYHILTIWIDYDSDANAGNRQLVVDLRNATDTVFARVIVGATQAASLTRRYMLAPSLADLAGFRNTTYLMTPFPPTAFLPTGFDIRVYDTSGISAGDDFELYVLVARRAV